LTPVTSTFNFHHFCLPPLTYLGFQYGLCHVIDKVGLHKMQFMKCTFLPSAKFDVKKILATWSDDDRTSCICPNACAADLHSSRWYSGTLRTGASRVVCMPAYFGFFNIIHLSHQGDKPRQLRVRNLIAWNALT